MIAVLNRLRKTSPFTQALTDWALRARARELYDLVAFGLVAIPLGFIGEPNWWLLATPPLGISALGGWGLLERSRGLRTSLGARISQGLLAAVVFVAAVIALLVLFFVLMSPPPTL
jgi:hypothetical protein